MLGNILTQVFSALQISLDYMTLLHDDDDIEK